MRKKILFILGIVDTGGVAKSMLSLLHVIDKTTYDVSILVFSNKGFFHHQIPSGVKIITDERATLLSNGIGGLKRLLFKGEILLALGSFVRCLLSVVNKGKAGLLLAKLMPHMTSEEYDLIVDYGGQHLLYYMVDKLNGKKKISFFHNDYRKWRYYEHMDRKYYAHVDGIYSISHVCVEALKEVFPEYAHKVKMMENISSPKLIHQLSEEPNSLQRKHQYVLTSLGYICTRKGSEIAMEVARMLKEAQIDFEWWFIGKMLDDMDYLGFVKQHHLDDNIKFLGIQSNPYPYIKEANIYVHLSKFEGKSIALDEVKILCKPVVVTNFSTVHDQFEDGVNASICEMNATSAYKRIMEIIEHPEIAKRYSDYLAQHIVDNSNEVNKLYELVES